jgi:hypothetical protein
LNQEKQGLIIFIILTRIIMLKALMLPNLKRLRSALIRNPFF